MTRQVVWRFSDLTLTDVSVDLELHLLSPAILTLKLDPHSPVRPGSIFVATRSLTRGGLAQRLFTSMEPTTRIKRAEP